MILEVTQQSIDEAIKNEFEQACKCYGAYFNSSHEGYAVLREEIEEAKDNIEEMLRHLSEMWETVKTDDVEGYLKEARLIGLYANFLACEACQVAAVVKKIKG